MSVEILFPQISNNASHTKNYNFVSLLYMYDGYFTFIMLTALHHFNLKLKRNQKRPTQKSVKSKYNFSASSRQISIQASVLITQLPILIAKPILKLLASLTLYLTHCVVVTLYSCHTVYMSYCVAFTL